MKGDILVASDGRGTVTVTLPLTIAQQGGSPTLTLNARDAKALGWRLIYAANSHTPIAPMVAKPKGGK